MHSSSSFRHVNDGNRAQAPTYSGASDMEIDARQHQGHTTRSHFSHTNTNTNTSNTNPYAHAYTYARPSAHTNTNAVFGPVRLGGSPTNVTATTTLVRGAPGASSSSAPVASRQSDTSISMAMVPVSDVQDHDEQQQPSDELLDDFKNQVKTWMELDNIIKKLQEMLKERRAYKNQLTQKIVRFMNQYNIEDLDTREGSLRSRVSYTKTPLTQKMIKENIKAYFAGMGNTIVGAQVTEAVFNANNRDRIERVSLKRVP